MDLPDSGEAERQQVRDLPEVQPHVTEHRYYRVTCPPWGATVAAERPVGVPAGAFGVRVVALVHLGAVAARVRSNDFSRWQRCGTTEVVTTNRGDISAHLY